MINPREEIDRLNVLLSENLQKTKELDKERYKLFAKHNKAIKKYHEYLESVKKD